MSLNPSIFGVAAPAFESGVNTIALDHVVVLSEKFDEGNIQFESVINGFREWENIGDHYEIELQMFLYKYADPAAKYAELKTYHRTLVDKFYRRQDGQAFRNSDEDYVKFRFDQLIPSIIFSNGEFLDIVKLKFISADILKYSSGALESES